MKIQNLFLNKQQRYSLSWQELANHYNLCVAKGVEENGKINIDEHAYLTEVQKELKERPDNPQLHLFGSLSK
jgi:hypothetical protein